MIDYNTTTYTIPIPETSLTSSGPWDLVAITPPANARVELMRIDIGQKSTNIPATNQQLMTQVLSGVTGTTLNGSQITPQNTKRWAAASTAGSIAYGPGIGQLTTSSAVSILNKPTDYSGALDWQPREYEEYVFDVSQQFSIRLEAPAETILVSGTIWIRERNTKG